MAVTPVRLQIHIIYMVCLVEEIKAFPEENLPKHNLHRLVKKPALKMLRLFGKTLQTE
jgi:hypothetical protein